MTYLRGEYIYKKLEDENNIIDDDTILSIGEITIVFMPLLALTSVGLISCLTKFFINNMQPFRN